MLTIWGRRSSFNLQKVMWLVDELELGHTHIEAGGEFGLVETPEFLAMNPHGKVPVIDDDGTVVWESHAILRYLAAQNPESSFWAGDPAERSNAERWMDWLQTSLQPAFLLGVFWAYYRTPEAARDRARVERNIAACGRHFRLLDQLLADNDFILGDTISLADITIGTALYRYFNIDIERPPVAKVEAWYHRLQQRPAYRKHVMAPFDELYGRLDY